MLDYSHGAPNSNYVAVRVNGVTYKKHRIVAGIQVGRVLETYEIVHHIDGDPTNNDPSNLKIMTKAAHTSLHTRKHSDERVYEALSYIAQGDRIVDAAKKANMAWQTLTDVLKARARKDVLDKFIKENGRNSIKRYLPRGYAANVI